MSEQTQRFFAYGTLMPGSWNHGRIAKHVHSARPGRVDGVLVDLGAFPALIHGQGIARGVLLEVDDEALKITDRLEGYSPDRPACFYERREITVTCDDGHTVTAWTYSVDADLVADRPRLVVGRERGIPVHAWSPRT